MKSTNTIARIASTLMYLAVFASASFAATNPLSYPQGLAVDAKGNLYVANSAANNILVFSPAYVLQKSETITQNISFPTAVAFDPLGNLWVANAEPSNGGASGSIAEYIGGKQNTNATITAFIENPLAMTIDAIDNIWVVNNLTNILVFSSTSAYAPPAALLQLITPTPPVYGVAIAASDVVAWGSNSGLFLGPEALPSGAIENPAAFPTLTGFALASAAGGNLYVANGDGSIDIITTTPAADPFLKLSFVPSGMAVDKVRGRLYISNSGGNSILVYSTAGTLLHTIQ
ncbi:MAG: hypothetical protein ABSD75_14465 [Terriglobales bacterium]|jgi:DNA-binding beta-propeller fold protein YncE